MIKARTSRATITNYLGYKLVTELSLSLLHSLLRVAVAIMLLFGEVVGLEITKSCHKLTFLSLLLLSSPLLATVKGSWEGY